jgi:rubrerythrin
MSNEPLNFEKQILSLALMEKELYELYTNLSLKVEDLSARTLFSYIATDSLKHSTILATIIDEVDGQKTREIDCDVNFIYNKEMIKSLSKDVSKTRRINYEELISLIDTLTGFESLLLTEYKKAFHLEFKSFAKYYQEKDKDNDLNIFDLIIGDEERHQRILASITRLFDNRMSFKSMAPIVKYQNPDSWYVPPRRSSA